MEWKGELKSKNGRKTSRYMQLVAHDYRLRTNIYRVFNYVPTTILSSFNTSTNLIFTINLGDEYLLLQVSCHFSLKSVLFGQYIICSPDSCSTLFMQVGGDNKVQQCYNAATISIQWMC